MCRLSLAENMRKFYYLGHSDWLKKRRARLVDTCRTGQGVLVLGLRKFGYAKLADKVETVLFTVSNGET